MPKLKKTLSFLILIISLIAAAQFAAFTPKAQACSCPLMELPGDKMAEYALQTYDAIFAGEVTNIIDNPIPEIQANFHDYQADFKNLQTWKGSQSPQILLAFENTGGCEYFFQQGEQYLVYAYKKSGKNNQTALTTNICSPTKKLADAGEEIAYLNKLALKDTSPPINEKPTMPPGGTLNIITKVGEETKEFPLKHTDVRAEISGFISRVVVTQEFVNPYEEPIEAVYTFPLPQNAAVDAMEMKIGERVIKAQIKKREEARQLYEEAKASGRRAGLLEQERPNIFTQSVANILPGDSILVTIQYIETLEYERGTYTFVFPMTVGPRYIPFGGITDAERITPPVLKPGERSGHDISLNVLINAGFPIKDIRSKNHKIEEPLLEAPVEINPKLREVKLSAFDSIPNKDFILEYDVGGDTPQFTLLTHKKPGQDHGYFTLIAQPQLAPTQDEITPKEIIFVVDSSGSMSGEPISRVKQAMRYALKNLNPSDTFYLFSFSNEVRGLSQMPLSNTPENIERGVRYINDLAGGGGTEMLKGVKAAYALPQDASRLRYVVMLTDGYIGNEDEILAEIQAHQNDARFFSFGIGSSPNRYLIEQMALQGRGLSFYLNLTEDSDKVIHDFYERIANPVLTDISLNWGNAEVMEVYPNPVQDLFSAKPLYLYGKYAAGTNAAITIAGKVKGSEQKTTLNATFDNANEQNEGLASIWARQKVKALEASMYRGENPQTVEGITNLALAYSIVTKYTSFVAFEEKPVIDKPGETVRVPVELPEGASYEGIFGAELEKSDIGLAAPIAPPSGSLGQAQDMGTTFSESTGLGRTNAEDIHDVLIRLITRIYTKFLLILGICFLITSSIKLKHLFTKQPVSKAVKTFLWIELMCILLIGISWIVVNYLRTSTVYDEKSTLLIENTKAAIFVGLTTISIVTLLALGGSVWGIIQTLKKHGTKKQQQKKSLLPTTQTPNQPEEETKK